MVEYRFLRETDVPQIYSTFTKSFADYQIQASPSQEVVRRLMVRRGVGYDLSVGAFDGDDMVAVMATGYGEWQGSPAAYDIFTGVTPDYRRRGIAGAMIEFVRPTLVERGAECFLLEVLQTNEPAIKVYRRLGMTISREFACFKLERDALVTTRANRDVAIVEFDDPDWSAWHEFWSWQPSWQNSSASVERSLDGHVCFGALSGKECVGYAIAEPATHELCQLAVAPRYRRRGIGTQLLAAASNAMDNGSLRIINIDGGSAADLAFYESRGSQDFVRQYEMILRFRE